MIEESPRYVYNRATFAPTYFTDEHAQGMTLRDHFAGLAMQGIVSQKGDFVDMNYGNPMLIADASYFMADAMLERRKT